MTIIYFVLILSTIILIHEFGHFICAKKAGVYVHEFSLGMGPRLFKWNRKNDETDYSIRLFPIGGYVSMAGEEIELDENIEEEKRMQSKTWLQRFSIVVAGVVMNFILAFVLLIIIGFVNGTPINKPIIGEVIEDYPFALEGISSGDTIIKINKAKIKTIDRLLLELEVISNGDMVEFEILKENGEIKKYQITPIKIEQDEIVSYSFGFTLSDKQDTSFFRVIKYAFNKMFSLLNQMFYTIVYLITGKISLKSLSGPIGIFTVVGEAATYGFINIIYLTALLSINVGFINILPLPAFDGGRLLFLIIEKIKGSQVDAKIENIIHSIGLILLLILMVVICYNDIVRIFM